MVWLAGKLQRDLATTAKYVEVQREKMSRDGLVHGLRPITIHV